MELAEPDEKMVDYVTECVMAEVPLAASGLVSAQARLLLKAGFTPQQAFAVALLQNVR